MTNKNLFLNKFASTKLIDDGYKAKILEEIIDKSPMAINLWDNNMKNVMFNKFAMDIFNVTDKEKYVENFFRLSPEYQPNGILSKKHGINNFEIAIRDGYHKFNWMHKDENDKEIPTEITLVKLDINDEETYIISYINDLRFEFLNAKPRSYDYYFNDILPRNVLLKEVSNLTEEWFFSVDVRTGYFHYYGKIWDEDIENHRILKDDEAFNMNLVHHEDIPIMVEMMNNLIDSEKTEYDIRLMTDNGVHEYFRISYKHVSDENGNIVFIVGKGRNIHLQKMFEERSQKDLLTECYNKISSENIVGDKLAYLPNKQHAFFIVDIDNFKAINDNLGHYFGDVVLREISSSLKEIFRDEDVVSRIGGDEFVVFLENISNVKLIKDKANTILEVYNKTYSGDNQDYSISGSIGIAIYPQDGTTYDELYKNADKALNQAKLLGKNRYVMYSKELRVGTTRSITKIENATRIASSFFDYELISEVFNIIYENNGSSSSINNALEHVCKKYKADRCYIFETFDGGENYSNTFEWCKEGISKEIENLQNISKVLLKDFFDKAHNSVIYSNNLRETIDDDEAFRRMIDQGILSFIHAQIRRDNIVTFFIGLDDTKKTRIWNEREINSLQYIGKIISIIRQSVVLDQQVNKLATYNQNSTYILDNIDNVVYVSDINNYNLLYLNRSGKEAVGVYNDEDYLNKKCYKILQGKDDVCEFCTNHLLKSNEYYEWSYYNPIIKSTFLLKDKLIPFNGKLARLEIATDVSKVINLENELEDKLKDEKFLIYCVEMLHSGDEPNHSINRLLDVVCSYYEADRSYIFEISEDKKHISNTYEHVTIGQEAHISEFQKIDIIELDTLIEKLKKYTSLTIDIEETFKDKDSLEYQIMATHGIDSVTIGSIINKNNEITGFVGVDNPKTNVDKITIIDSVAKFTASFIEKTKLINKLNNLSYYDMLTGVKNRYSYSLKLKNIDYAKIDSLGVAYVDILALSAINDTRGGGFGDLILKDLAKMLSEIFKESVYRVGGDEFVVLVTNMNEIDFEKKIIELKNYLYFENRFEVSIGYTWNQGIHNEYKFKDLDEGKKYTKMLSENLDIEIKNSKYIVYLQPQINFETNEVTSAEALVRRIGSLDSLQPPISFIPFYEKEGIISQIDTFVLEEVCKTFRIWKDKGCKTLDYIAVNCSRMTIAKEGIVDIFVDICNKYDVEPKKIVIEITETINGISEKLLSRIINNFKDAGFTISLDDFGSGYSNFSSLVISNFDEIKIDMKLIKDIDTNKKSKILTSVAIGLCTQLGNTISIAEGVETKKQAEILKSLKCSKGQGYYFDKPLDIEDFSKKYIV